MSTVAGVGGAYWASSNFAAPKNLMRSLPPGFMKASTPTPVTLIDRLTTRDPSEFPSGHDSNTDSCTGRSLNVELLLSLMRAIFYIVRFVRHDSIPTWVFIFYRIMEYTVWRYLKGLTELHDDDNESKKIINCHPSCQ